MAITGNAEMSKLLERMSEEIQLLKAVNHYADLEEVIDNRNDFTVFKVPTIATSLVHSHEQ